MKSGVCFKITTLVTCFWWVPFSCVGLRQRDNILNPKTYIWIDRENSRLQSGQHPVPV